MTQLDKLVFEIDEDLSQEQGSRIKLNFNQWGKNFKCCATVYKIYIFRNHPKLVKDLQRIY